MNEKYEFPPLTLLNDRKDKEEDNLKYYDNAKKLQTAFESFNIDAKVEKVLVGPSFITYEIKLGLGIRISKIKNLKSDLELCIGAEILDIKPNFKTHLIDVESIREEKEIVTLREVLESSEYRSSESKLTIALGKDIKGENRVADLIELLHISISGTTGSGCSIFLHTLINSILFKAKPNEVKFLMIDPKIAELSEYNGIPHLLIPVITDPKKAAAALWWVVQEMYTRYNLFAGKNVRNLETYNDLVENEEKSKLPEIVIVIDELADLMMSSKEEIEKPICLLAQMSRAAGIHLVIVTQRPSTDVITGIVKANIPSKIAFSVSSYIDSKTILDRTGAENLLGKGDMLFYPVGEANPIRIQGAYISEEEIKNVVEFLKKECETQYDKSILELIEKHIAPEDNLYDEDYDDSDPLLDEAIDLVVETGEASTAFIQRRFKVNYARAGRIVDQMEERGIISGYQGSRPREVLMSKKRWNELKRYNNCD